MVLTLSLMTLPEGSRAQTLKQETTGCERTITATANGRFTSESTTSFVSMDFMNGGTNTWLWGLGKSWIHQGAWVCPQTIADPLPHESDEMFLCGFSATVENNAVTDGNKFDGLRAIFCHKYDWTRQTTKDVFNCQGGNVRQKVFVPTGGTNMFGGNGCGSSCSPETGTGTYLRCLERGCDTSDSYRGLLGIAHEGCVSGVDHSGNGNDYCYDDNYPYLQCKNVPSEYVDYEDMCDSNTFIDYLQIKYARGVTSIKFGCRPLKNVPTDPDATRTFKYVKSLVGSSSHSTQTYSLTNQFFCGVKAKYGATDNTNPYRDVYHEPKGFDGILGLEFMICDAYDCRNKLQKTLNSIEPRVYKVVPFNTDFEKPAFETIPQKNVNYNETLDQSNNILENFSHYIINLDNFNCPIESCQIMENCPGSPTLKAIDSSNPDVWPITPTEIISMAADYSQWDNTHLYHVNTDPRKLFSLTYLCLECKTTDKYANSDQTFVSDPFDINIQCEDGIEISMADQTTGSLQENSLVNNPNQRQHVSIDHSIRPQFNFSSFYTTTSACPVDLYQISDDFYDPDNSTNLVSQNYYKFPAGITAYDPVDARETIYTSQFGQTDIAETPQPTLSGTLSSGRYSIKVFDGENPMIYSFKIKAWALGGLFTTTPLHRIPNSGMSSFVTPTMTIEAYCPTFLGNMDELESNPLSNHITWIGAPPQQSIYTMSKHYEPMLPKCHSIIAYEAIDLSHPGILTYPASSCSTNPCISWDIDSSVAHESPPVTFKIRATSDLGIHYISSPLQITIAADSDFQPNLEPSSLLFISGIFMIGETRLFEIDAFQETLFGLEVTNYILTTDLTSTTQTLSSPGCSSFMTSNIAGSKQANGRIGFAIDTSSIYTSLCQVRVYAQLDLFPQIYAFTDTQFISVLCGSEQIQIDPTYAQLVELTYKKGELQVNLQSPYQLASIFSSSYNQDCPVTNLHRDVSTMGCSPQSNVILTGSFPQTLNFDASNNFQETVCITASTGVISVSPTFKILVTVCGNEQLTAASLNQSITQLQINEGQPFQLPFDDSWFIKDATNSKDWCFQPLTYNLKSGSDCLGAVNTADFSLDSSLRQINMTAANPLKDEIICLEAASKGQVKAVQKITINICGDEVISYQELFWDKRYFTFDRAPTSQFETIELSSLGFEFTNSRLKCPQNYSFYQIEDGQETNFTGPEIEVDQITGDIRVDVSIPLKLKGYVMSYSQFLRSSAISAIVQINVCGYEYIDLGWDEEIQFGLIENNGLNTIADKPYAPMFEKKLNNSNCSVTSYTLKKDMGREVQNFTDLAPFEKRDFFLKDGLVWTNTSLDMFEHGIADQLFVERFTFYIEGITRGLKKFYLAIFIDFHKNMVMNQNEQGDIFFFFNCPALPPTFCGSFQKITKLETMVQKGTPPEYETLLEEIGFPSLSLDQPNDLPFDNSTKIDQVNGIMHKELMTQSIADYTFKNPDSPLPVDELDIAIFNHAKFVAFGIMGNGSECRYESSTAAEVLDVSASIKAGIFDILTDTKEKMKQREEKAREDRKQFDQSMGDKSKKDVNKKIEQVKVVQFSFVWDKQRGLNPYAFIKFSKEIQAFNETNFEQLKQIFQIKIQSGNDGSEIKGQYATKTKSRYLCEDQSCNKDLAEAELEFETSKEQQSDAFETLQHYWSFDSLQSNKIEIKLEFQYPYNVSLGKSSNDRIMLKIRDNELLRDKENNLTMDLSQIDTWFDFEIGTRPAEPEIEAQMVDTVNKVSVLLVVLQASGLLGNILLSKALQEAWGVLNAQIIIIHLILFKCQMTNPGNMITFNSLLTDLTQKDMYPTDEIYEATFNFTAKESEIEYFEILGYEGANFITMSGSVLINILIPIFTYMFQSLALKLTYKYKEKKFMRYIGTKISQVQVTATIIPLFIIGYLEIIFCGIISAKGLTKEDFIRKNGSDIFAALFLIFILIFMTSLPIILIYVARKYKGRLDDPEIQNKYGFFFGEMNVHCFWSSLYNMFFMLRRTLFALIIIEMHEHSGLQLIFNSYLSMAMVIYIAHFRPYISKSMNHSEIFNEVCGFLVIYFLMWMAVLPQIDVSEISTLETAGWCYITVVSFNIVVNFVKVGYSALKNLPSFCKSLGEQCKRRKYQWLKRQYFEEKRRNLAKNPKSQRVQFIFNESQKLQSYEKCQAELGQLRKQHLKELRWMQSGQIYDQDFLQFMREQYKNEVDLLHLKHFGYSRRKNDELGVMNVRLSNQNQMLEGNFVHNDQLFLVGKPPYRELQYIKIQDKYKDKDGNFRPEQVKSMNQEVREAQTKNLLKFLESNGYYFVAIKKDGNVGARVVSLRQYGSQKEHKRVRQETCDFMKIQLQKQFNGELSSKEYTRKLAYISEKEENGQKFTKKEMKACSDLYGFPMVVFSIKNQMMYFDLLIAPSDQDNNYKCPLYILSHDNHLTALLHPKQSNLKKFYKEKGEKVERFKFKDAQWNLNFMSKGIKKGPQILEQIPAKTKKKRLDIKYQIQPLRFVEKTNHKREASGKRRQKESDYMGFENSSTVKRQQKEFMEEYKQWRKDPSNKNQKFTKTWR